MLSAVKSFIGSTLTSLKIKKLLAFEKETITNMTAVLSSPKRILIVPRPRIGVVILAAQTFKAIKNRFSDSELFVLVPEEAISIVRNDPFLDDVISFPQRLLNAPFGSSYNQLLLNLKKNEFDVLFYLDRTIDPHIAYISRKSDAKVRIGYHIDEGEKLFNVEIKPSRKSKYEVDFYFDLLHPIGVNREPREIFFKLSEMNLQEIRNRFLSEYKLHNNKRIIAVDFTEVIDNFQLKSNQLMEIIERLITQKLQTVLLIYDESAKKKVSKLKEKFGRQIILSEKTPISKTAALIHFCDVVIAQNTDILQLCFAMQKPTVALIDKNELLRWVPPAPYPEWLKPIIPPALGNISSSELTLALNQLGSL